MSKTMHGRCECGQVAFTIDSLKDAVTVCHCSQCRRMSGHLWAATHAPFNDLMFSEQSGLEWYTSSDFAKRGFCKCCGSSLFYRMNGEDSVGIAAGCFDEPTTFKIERHIFVANKGDYYDVMDDKPQILKY